ncbi:hypothetical protein L0244_22280 [bacterium]|nr:hypothetical protein [bacterium]
MTKIPELFKRKLKNTHLAGDELLKMEVTLIQRTQPAVSDVSTYNHLFPIVETFSIKMYDSGYLRSFR